MCSTGRWEFQSTRFAGCFHSDKQITQSFSSKINSSEQTTGLVCHHFVFSGWGWPWLRPPSPAPPWSQPFGSPSTGGSCIFLSFVLVHYRLGQGFFWHRSKQK